MLALVATRPDEAGTVGIWGIHLLVACQPGERVRTMARVAVVSAVWVGVITSWRLHVHGEWVSNTFAPKVEGGLARGPSQPWPCIRCGRPRTPVARARSSLPWPSLTVPSEIAGAAAYVVLRRCRRPATRVAGTAATPRRATANRVRPAGWRRRRRPSGPACLDRSRRHSRAQAPTRG